MCIKSLSVLQFEKMEDCKGVQCEVWKNVKEAGHKKNTYRLWVTRGEAAYSPVTPQRFEIEGFNSLLGSHNDKYSIEYSDFSSQTEPDIFTPPAGFTCEEFPEERQILANPFQDYVNTHPVSHAHLMLGPFKEKFNRQNESEKEHEKRENLFLHTFSFVHSNNRAGLTYSVGINHFADKKELTRMTGGLLPKKKKEDAKKSTE
nr:uncharacterized protein si:dkey-183k8.2 [Danio rerio]|eukprot:XP_021332958.1 uncharacterized protein si:dkey-183k8.2 [Danio rerio]